MAAGWLLCALINEESPPEAPLQFYGQGLEVLLLCWGRVEEHRQHLPLQHQGQAGGSFFITPAAVLHR